MTHSLSTNSMPSTITTDVHENPAAIIEKWSHEYHADSIEKKTKFNCKRFCW